MLVGQHGVLRECGQSSGQGELCDLYTTAILEKGLLETLIVCTCRLGNRKTLKTVCHSPSLLSERDNLKSDLANESQWIN